MVTYREYTTGVDGCIDKAVLRILLRKPRILPPVLSVHDQTKRFPYALFTFAAHWVVLKPRGKLALSEGPPTTSCVLRDLHLFSDPEFFTVANRPRIHGERPQSTPG